MLGRLFSYLQYNALYAIISRNFVSRPSILRARAKHLKLGQRGESIAKNTLLERGLVFLMQNYGGRHGEIDLIFLDDDVLCFVEVKTRHRRNFYRPADAVTKVKQQNIRLTAKAYLKAIGKKNAPCRFDIVEVIFEKKRLIEVTHLVSAFK